MGETILINYIINLQNNTCSNAVRRTSLVDGAMRGSDGAIFLAREVSWENKVRRAQGWVEVKEANKGGELFPEMGDLYLGSVTGNNVVWTRDWKSSGTGARRAQWFQMCLEQKLVTSTTRLISLRLGPRFLRIPAALWFLVTAFSAFWLLPTLLLQLSQNISHWNHWERFSDGVSQPASMIAWLWWTGSSKMYKYNNFKNCQYVE